MANWRPALVEASIERRDRFGPVPDHVVILGLGPSLETYVNLAKCRGGRRQVADEVWAINALGDVLGCDRIFHMDDVLIQEARAKDDPASNIAAMLEWLRNHPGPIYTSVVRDGYPGLLAFPLEDVIKDGGYAYFNSTAAYAVAFAVYLGVKKISLFGCDFSYPNSHHAEKGRACVEFWLGIAAARGIELGTSQHSSLLDGCEGQSGRLYGYDAVDVTISDEGQVSFAPKAEIPTASEIEARYDHSKPTVNPELLRKAAGA